MAWSDLPEDLLHCIASRLHVVDFLRFSIVSTSWNAAVANNALSRTRRPPSPWLLLPSDAGEAWDTLTFRDLIVEEGSVGYHRRFSSLRNQISGRRCFGSKDGWLVTVDKTDLKPILFNPLTKAELSLPSLFTIPENKWHRMKPRYAPDGSIESFYDEINGDESLAHKFRDAFFEKIVISSFDSLGTAVVIYGYYRLLAMAKPGDQAWVLGPQLPPYHIDEMGDYEDVYYHEEEQMFYAITHLSMVLAFDLNGRNVKLICSPVQFDVHSEWARKYSDCRNYIVFLSGNLLKVERDIPWSSKEDDTIFTGKTTRFSVIKFVSVGADSSFSDWVLVNDLGDYSLFVGYNQTFILHHTTAPEIKSNCIYFTDHWPDICGQNGECDAGFFDLHNNCFQYFFDSYSGPNWPPTIWFTPSLS